MTYSLAWLADVLTLAGVAVSEVSGWQTRGHGEFGPARGVLLHHTAGARTGNMPSLATLIDGRPDLAGPLCNLGLARDGTFYLVAAGKAWHAGQGNWHGVTDGNGSLIGIEMENTGLANDPWPQAQLIAARKGVSALLKHIGASAEMCAGHKEFALPHGRKVDPSLDCGAFRASLEATQ